MKIQVLFCQIRRDETGGGSKVVDRGREAEVSQRVEKLYLFFVIECTNCSPTHTSR